MKFFLLFLIPTTIVLTLSACASSEHSVSSGGGETSPVVVVDSFVHEFYEGHVTNLSAFLNKYTDWPDFGPGDSTKIARGLSIRPLTKTEKVATVEVKFKVVGEESLGKFTVLTLPFFASARARRIILPNSGLRLRSSDSGADRSAVGAAACPSQALRNDALWRSPDDIFSAGDSEFETLHFAREERTRHEI